jgi:hypothetical protein
MSTKKIACNDFIAAAMASLRKFAVQTRVPNKGGAKHNTAAVQICRHLALLNATPTFDEIVEVGKLVAVIAAHDVAHPVAEKGKAPLLHAEAARLSLREAAKLSR